MLTCFSIHFTVVVVIFALAISAASIPKPRGKGNGISIPLTKYSSSLNSKNSVNIDGLKSRAISHTTKVLPGLENHERSTGTAQPYASTERGSQNWKRDYLTVSELDLALNNDYWTGYIWVGAPPKPFSVLVDTGCSDLIIPASNGDENCKSHDHLFNAASSSTAKNLDKTFSAQFVDGNFAFGNQYIDNITISDFTVDKQTIGVATTYSPKWGKSFMPQDGILGLALSSASVFPASSLFETLFSEGKLADRVFAFKLTKSGEGILYIGGVDEEQYTGDITFVNVHPANEGRWMVVADDVRVNNKPVLGRIAAVIDTGTNHIIGNQDQVLTLHEIYGGEAFQNGWHTFPCDHFPDVSFTFGGKPFTIPARELNLGPVMEGSSDCFSGIYGPSKTLPLGAWIIGYNFLELFYTVFNMDSKQPQVGFAQLATGASSSSEA